MGAYSIYSRAIYVGTNVLRVREYDGLNYAQRPIFQDSKLAKDYDSF